MSAASDGPDPRPVPRRSTPPRVRLAPPGSKSLTNRLYVLAALARGTSDVRRPLRSDDCDRLLAALVALGAEATWAGEDVRVRGVGGRFPRGGRLDLGDGGTPARFALAAATLADAPSVVDGSPRLRERPMDEGAALLRALGADIALVGPRGGLPAEVRPVDGPAGGTVRAGRTASSQFLSALLLVGPCLRDGLVLACTEPPTSRTYLELTAAVLADLGLLDEAASDRTAAAPRLVVPPAPGGAPAAFERTVEPDASSVLYWRVAEALLPGARIELPAIGDVQPDAGAIAAIPRVGTGATIDAEAFPDGALALAALAAARDAPTVLTGLHTLRVKETDRIAALETELRRVGCAVESSDDHLAIDPRPAHRAPVTIETYDDHRMAMAFAVLGLARGGLSVRDPGCTAKSYPGFWDDLERVARAPEA